MSDENRIVKVDEEGNIATYAGNGYLHSFNGKPAFIGPDGMMAWYDMGHVIKIVCSDEL